MIISCRRCERVVSPGRNRQGSRRPRIIIRKILRPRSLHAGHHHKTSQQGSRIPLHHRTVPFRPHTGRPVKTCCVPAAAVRASDHFPHIAKQHRPLDTSRAVLSFFGTINHKLFYFASATPSCQADRHDKKPRTGSLSQPLLQCYLKMRSQSPTYHAFSVFSIVSYLQAKENYSFSVNAFHVLSRTLSSSFI